MTAAASRLPKRRLCVSGFDFAQPGPISRIRLSTGLPQTKRPDLPPLPIRDQDGGLRESLTETVGNVFDHGCKLDAVDAVNASRKLKFTRGFCCYGCVWFRKRLGLKLTLFAGDGCAEYLRCRGDSRCSLAF